MKAFRPLAAAALLAIAGFVAYRVFLHVVEPVVPAVVVRTTDAHRLLSRSIPARIDRFLHDRPPSQGERSNDPRLIALTFDDGPYPVQTPLLLDELATLRIPATFFLIGDDAELFPDLVRRIARAGDEIANHTQTHPPDFDALSGRQVTSELARGASTLSSIVSDPAIHTMMRPPHGRYTEATVVTAQRDGYDVILWNDDPGDWRPIAPAAIVAHVERFASAPEIMLLHSGRQNTIDALPDIVARFRTEGFTFVTVAQLMARVPAREILHPEKLAL